MTWIRRSTVLLLAIAFLGVSAAPPASAEAATGEPASAAKKKKKKKKCKVKKKGKKGKRAKNKCKKAGGGSGGGSSLPGQPTRPVPLAPSGSGSDSGSGSGSGSGSTTYQVSGITLANNPVLGGAGTSGEVTISEAAPAGGQPVQLQSGNPARAAVPSSVHVAAGQTSANFSVSTTAGPTVAVSLTASIGGSSDAVVLNVVEKPSVSRVELAYKCFPGVGSFGSNRVFLDVPAPDDTVVGLSSSGTELTFASTGTTTASVTVPDGAISALFGVNTLAPSLGVTVTATLDSSTADDTASIRDGATQGELDELSLSPTTVTPGGSSTGTVTLDCEAIAPGATVTLESDTPGVTFATTGTQNATATVLENQLSTTFQVNVAPGVTENEATITAELGSVQLQAVLSIQGLDT